MSHEHRPDGRLRLAAALLVGFTVSLIRSIDTLLILTLFATVAAVVITVRDEEFPRILLKRLAIVNFFVAWIWITLPIDWLTLSWRTSGSELALQLTLRINVIALTVSTLLSRMSGIDLARAAVGLGVPQSLGTLLALAVRSIVLLDSTRSRLEQAMRARAYRATVSLRTIRVSAQLVSWLIVHALVRSERIRVGLTARGYTTTRWPTRQHSHWHALPISEWLLFFGVVAAIVLAWLLPIIWN
jgi:cobalt/nickel transport system permease protein